MAQVRLIEGAEITPAMGWRALCREERCRWSASDVSKVRVQIACIRHEHPCWAPSYGRIREDTITRSR
jgi:hypothetical protein